MRSRDVRRNARAVVDDLQFERQAVALLGQRHLADGAARVAEGTIVPLPFIACLGIAGDVGIGLDQLLAVADKGQAGWYRSRGGPSRGNSGVDQATRAREFRGWTPAPAASAAAGQQALHQILQAIRFLDDDLRVFARASGLPVRPARVRAAAPPADAPSGS